MVDAAIGIWAAHRVAVRLHGVPFTPYNRATFYGGEAAGYADYPFHDELQQA